jgi:hypothetical protein
MAAIGGVRPSNQAEWYDMASRIRAAAPFLCAFATVVAIALPALADDLSLKRVLLSSGGVGYYEYEARVSGNAVLALEVPLEQVDDVLKSIVVFDDKGGVGAVRLPGREPLAQFFRELPFGPGALNSASALFEALKGAEVVVSGKRALTGRLIGIEAETVLLPDGLGTTLRHRVSLLTAAGVQQFVLEEQDSVHFAEVALEAQVEGALNAIAENRVRDRRSFEIEARGAGERVVRVGYVVGAPLWKTSYRLNLGTQKNGLQGWAHLENLSGQDWSGVELTLASGNPVTFRQALYTAYFVARPEVPVEVLGRVLPPVNEGAIALDDTARDERRQRLGRAAATSGAAPGAEEYELAAKAAEAPMMAALDGGYAGEPAPPPPSPAEVAGAALATAREEAATQVILRLSEPVTLASGQSLTVPVIDASVPAAAIALYQPSTHARHPLAAVRLTNDTGTGLPPGVMTLYDGRGAAVAYVGDARLAPLPAKDERLLSFALDQAILIDREEKSARTVTAGTIGQGNLRLTVRQNERTLYRVKSSAPDARLVLIEHPRRYDWELEKGHEGVELTDSAYRVPVEVAPGAAVETEVGLVRTVWESYSLADMGPDNLVYFAESGELEPKLKAAFRQLADRKAAIETMKRRIEALEQSKNRLFEDQSRLRDNLSRVPSESDLHARYLAKLAAEETELDKIGLEIESTREAVHAAETAYGELIRTLEV